VAWLSGAVIVLVSAGFALSPGPMDGLPGIRNPFGLEKYPWVADATLGVAPLLALCILVAAVSLVLRFLRSGGDEREQIKWLAFAASILGLGFFSYVIPANILPDGAGGVDRLWVNLLEDALTLSLAGVPVAVGIAILRHGLFDIDIIIRRTLIYSVLTLLLGLIYLGCIIVSRILIAPLTGASELAIVASTLAIAALFHPLRQRIQNLIDRRFYRRKYDAAKVLAAFGATARDETELQRLTAEMLRVVDETMQPEFVGLWLREPATRSTLDSARPDSTPPQ
jgi:hypothetical protein